MLCVETTEGQRSGPSGLHDDEEDDDNDDERIWQHKCQEKNDNRSAYIIVVIVTDGAIPTPVMLQSLLRVEFGD